MIQSNHPFISNYFKDLYDYEVIVTNMEDLPPEEIWRWYNKRCTVENKIDELKTGLAIDQASQHETSRNVAFMWFKVLAYNLLNWFRLALLPPGISKCEIITVRRLILNVPGNVVGNGRYRHVRLAPNAWLKETVEKQGKHQGVPVFKGMVNGGEYKLKGSWNLNLSQPFSPVYAGLILVLPFLPIFQQLLKALDFNPLKKLQTAYNA